MKKYRLEHPNCKYCYYAHLFLIGSGVGCNITYKEISFPKLKAKKCKLYKPKEINFDI